MGRGTNQGKAAAFVSAPMRATQRQPLVSSPLTPQAPMPAAAAVYAPPAPRPMMSSDLWPSTQTMIVDQSEVSALRVAWNHYGAQISLSQVGNVLNTQEGYQMEMTDDQRRDARWLLVNRLKAVDPGWQIGERETTLSLLRKLSQAAV